jgi:hypothetical protein
MQHQQPQAPQTYRKSLLIRVQQHLTQQEILRTGLSVQAPNLTNDDMLLVKIATVVEQIMTELGEAVSEKDTITVITKMVLNLMKQNVC